jgi:hypothetical protein
MVFVFLSALCFTTSLLSCGQASNSTYKRDFAKADLEKLRWIEGDWRGSDAKGQNPFYERYRFNNDSKIETASFSDTTFTKINDSGTVYFENGEIIHKGGEMVWAASKLEEGMIEFVPKEKAMNSFVWQKESADVWTARLINKDAQGKLIETVYRMERIK